MIDTLPINSWFEVAAPLVALVVAYALFYEGILFKLTDWHVFRKMLPFLDAEAREAGFYTSYTITPREHVGMLALDRTAALELFEELGFMDVPLAAHKTDWQGRREIASLGHYGMDGAKIHAMPKLKRFLYMAFILQRQLHVTLFEAESGDIIVTAHYEWSPYNVLKAFDHFRGNGYDTEKGVSMAQTKLTETKQFYPGETAEAADTDATIET